MSSVEDFWKLSDKIIENTQNAKIVFFILFAAVYIISISLWFSWIFWIRDLTTVIVFFVLLLWPTKSKINFPLRYQILMGINTHLLLLCVGISLGGGYEIKDILFSIVLFVISLNPFYKSKNLKPEHFDPNLMFPAPLQQHANYLLENDSESDWDSDSTVESDVDSAFSSEASAELEGEMEQEI